MDAAAGDAAVGAATRAALQEPAVSLPLAEPVAASFADAALRLVDKADFERLLAARQWGLSVHFAVHHLPVLPERLAGRTATPVAGMLSTAPAPACPQPVDDFPGSHWLGCVVPKRHARRAVTRSLLKRQVRSAFQRHCGALPKGLWLVRLRRAFATGQFVSAASAPLVRAVRGELDALLASTPR